MRAASDEEGLLNLTRKKIIPLMMIPHTTTSLALAKVLVDRPELSAILSFEDVVRYVDLIRCLKPLIAMQEASYHHDPPDTFSV